MRASQWARTAFHPCLLFISSHTNRPIAREGAVLRAMGLLGALVSAGISHKRWYGIEGFTLAFALGPLVSGSGASVRASQASMLCFAYLFVSVSTPSLCPSTHSPSSPQHWTVKNKYFHTHNQPDSSSPSHQQILACTSGQSTPRLN